MIFCAAAKISSDLVVLKVSVVKAFSSNLKVAVLVNEFGDINIDSQLWHWFGYMGITYETQSQQGFYRIRPKVAETYAWKGFEYDLTHVTELVPLRSWCPAEGGR